MISLIAAIGVVLALGGCVIEPGYPYGGYYGYGYGYHHHHHGGW